MIQIEDIDHLPELSWNPLSGKEFLFADESYKAQLIQFSTMKAIVRGEEILMVAGLYRETLTNPAFFWALLTKNFDRHAVRALLRYPLPSCITYIEAGNERAAKLARTFGFQPDEGGVLIGETMYDIYRRP